jgi:hypothetical protein
MSARDIAEIVGALLISAVWFWAGWMIGRRKG